MICDRPGDRPATLADEGSFVCRSCEQRHAHLLDDDDGDGCTDARQLTILSIEVDD
jgi:hypothetical protein